MAPKHLSVPLPKTTELLLDGCPGTHFNDANLTRFPYLHGELLNATFSFSDGASSHATCGDASVWNAQPS